MSTTIRAGETVQVKGLYVCVSCGEPAYFNKQMRKIGASEEFWVGAVMRSCFNPDCKQKVFALQ